MTRRPRTAPGRAGAALRALLLALAATAAWPAALPGAPVAVAADTDLTIVGDARYTALPDEGLVRVEVDVTARNRKRDTVARSFHFERGYLAVLPGTTGFAVEGLPGGRVVATRASATHTMLRIDFGTRLGFGDAVTFRLRFDLPDPGPESPTHVVRVGASLMTFPVWAFASDGARGASVRVVVPAGYEVAVEHGAFATREVGADGSTTLSTGALDEPLAFFAYVVGQRPAAYRETLLVVDGVAPTPIELRLRAWEDDPGWADRVAAWLDPAIRALRDLIGLPWPYAGPVVVEEAVNRTVSGYAARFAGDEGRIEIAYWASQLVVTHEAAHAWFNGDLLADRWANEAFASYYAFRAADLLELGAKRPAVTEELEAAAFPLNAWAAADPSSPVPPPDPVAEAYATAAALGLAEAIAERAGDGVLARVWAAAAARRGAYQPGDGPGRGAARPGPGPAPETVDAPPDWRGLLDLLEDEARRPFADLWRARVVRPDEAALLDARAATRWTHLRTTWLAGDWRLPRSVRDALRAWRFDVAERLLADARTLLAQRDALDGLAAREGLARPPVMRAQFEAGLLAEAAASAALERDLLLELDRARATGAAASGPLAAIGLLGSDPAGDLAAARAAYEAGELAAALELAERATGTWRDGAEEGRRRLVLLLAVVAALAVVGPATRRRLARRALPPAALAVAALVAGSLLPAATTCATAAPAPSAPAERPGPCATLPPTGTSDGARPAPDRPRDEGAERA